MFCNTGRFRKERADLVTDLNRSDRARLVADLDLPPIKARKVLAALAGGPDTSQAVSVLVSNPIACKQAPTPTHAREQACKHATSCVVSVTLTVEITATSLISRVCPVHRLLHYHHHCAHMQAGQEDHQEDHQGHD